MPKRVFSDRKRGGDVFYGGQRRSLSFPEMEAQTRRASKEAHQPFQLRQALPNSMQRRVERVRGIHIAIVLALAGIIIFLLWFFMGVYPSPIEGVSPAPDSTVRDPNVQFKVVIDGELSKKSVKFFVDGKDVTTNCAIDGKVISYKSLLTQGGHKAKVTYAGGGVMGDRDEAWGFLVDTVPPKLTITDKKMKPVEDSTKVEVTVKGQTDKGARVKIGGADVDVDAAGKFSGTTTASRYKSLEVSAFDTAGNKASSYVVTQKTPEAKGVHVSLFIAGSSSDLDKMIGLVDRTELNSLQIDLKDEAGMIGFEFDDPLAKQANSDNDYFDLNEVVDRMRYKDIYSICRIVVMKDPKLAKARPDLTVQDSGGGPWGKGFWMDPYSKEVWDYNIAIAVAAAKAGFNEVQFDYMRFPTEGDTSRCVFPHKDARNPGQVIADFVNYAREKLAPYNMFISADVFGLTASKQGEMGIGQKVEDISKLVDFLSPMVYPSHYNPGEYNIKSPESNPGDIVTKSLEDFLKKMKGTQAGLRPWLQDFSLKVTYTPDFVRRQIDATEALGIKQWLLWDPNCSYTESALKPAPNKK